MMRALLSVSDKTGLVDFARELVETYRVELVASGGTAKTLEAAGLPVTSVEALTGLPPVLDGRVKTLHPAIHAGILARDTEADRETLEANGWPMIDLVVVNLYPFEGIEFLSPGMLEERIRSGEIWDGMTLAAWSLVVQHFPGGRP